MTEFVYETNWVPKASDCSQDISLTNLFCADPSWILWYSAYTKYGCCMKGYVPIGQRLCLPDSGQELTFGLHTVCLSLPTSTINGNMANPCFILRLFKAETMLPSLQRSLRQRSALPHLQLQRLQEPQTTPQVPM